MVIPNISMKTPRRSELEGTIVRARLPAGSMPCSGHGVERVSPMSLSLRLNVTLIC